MPSPLDWPTRDLLAHRVDATPEATAVVDADHQRQFSYEALDELVAGVAGRLRSVGDSTVRDPSPTARVGTLLSPRLAFVATLHGTWRLGNSLVPLDPDGPPADLRDQADRADVDLLVCEAATEPTARDIAEGPVATVDRPSAESVSSLLLGSEESPVDGPDPVSLDRASEALVLFTSGTTGRPKGVRLTHGNLVASATASSFRLGLDPDERWLSPLPVYHMGGIAPLARSALYGTTVVIQDGSEPEPTVETIRQHRVSGISLVPTQLRRLLDAGWSPPSHLRFVLLGGAPAGADLVERCRAAEVPVCPTYGTTETASQIATAEPETAFAYPDSVGQPLLFTDVTIETDGEPAAPEETGEIVVSGPTVSPGYLDGESDFGPAGLHTGDLGYRDGDGRLYVVGRVDDAIQTGGELVQPEPVADALRSHDAVEDAAVVGLADDEWGERVVALVTPAQQSVDAAVLRERCRNRLAPQEVPKEIRFTADLPRTASGTIDRDAVRAHFD